MRTILALLVLALFPITLSAASRHADGDYVIVLNGNENPDVVQRQHRVGRRPGRDHQWTKNNGFHGFSAHLTGAQADNLESDTRVAVIEPDVAANAIPPLGPVWAGVSVAPSSKIALTPPGWQLRQNYSARNGRVLDTLSGMVPVLVGPIGTGIAGSDPTYVCFINYAAHTSSLVALTNITDSAAPTGGGMALRGTNLWIAIDTARCFAPISNFDTTGAWKILHYGISGSPPSSARLLDSFTYPIIGCTEINQSQAQLYYTPAGGIVTSFYMPNAFNISPLTNRYMGLIYRTPAGAWTYQYPIATLNPVDDINVEDLRTSFLAHPADNAVWGFSCEPGSDTIRATRIVESGGSYTYTVNKQWAYAGYPQQIAFETTPPGLVSDPYNNKLVLFYGSWVIAPTLPVASIYEPSTIVDVAANGTYTYIQNTNIYPGALMTGMAGMIESATKRSFVYRNMGGPFTGPVAFSEGMAGTNVPLSVVTVENGVWSNPKPFVDQADIMISYIQNAPGILYTHWPDNTVYLAYSSASTLTPWAENFGGTANDGGSATTVDGSDNIYVAGYYLGTSNFGGTNLTTAGGSGFALAKYDKLGVHQWSTGFSGTSGSITSTGIAVDTSGNIFVCGYFTGTANFGGTNCVSAGQQDAFLAKYSSTGQHLWSQRFGGPNIDTFNGLVLDASGRVSCIAGYAGSVSFGGATFTSTFGAAANIVLAKYSTTGAHLWSETFLAGNADYGLGIAKDASDNILITGAFYSWIDFGGGHLNAATAQYLDFFVAKFNSSGAYTWGKRYGGINGERGTALAVDSVGNVLVGGIFFQQTELGGGILTGTAIDQDMFLAKYSGTDGSYLWGKKITGNNGGWVNSVKIDSANRIGLGGYYYGTFDFGGTSKTSVSNSYDAFVAIYDTAGVLLNVTSHGGTLTDEVTAMSFDSSNDLIATGFFSGSGTFNTSSLTSRGGSDMFLMSLGAQSSPSIQTIPTGVSRIGCLSNALWQASSTTPINADVAIIDTGIQLNHPDLNVYTNVTFVSGTTTGNDDSGHGTHVAGIVGAKNNTIGSVGVAPGARLWAVKVLDSHGSGALSTIISGVDWVTQHAASIEVANMSLGGNGASESLRLAIQNSVAAGVVYVVASGNDGVDVYGGDWIFGTDDDFFPASYPEVATVSAIVDTDGIAGGLGTTTADGADDTLAIFANYGHSVIPGNPVFSPGASIDVAAPGVNIYSTFTNSSYSTMSGTSMASPHVAGEAALYIAANGRANNSTNVYAIRQAIINAATPQTSWGVNVTNPRPNNDQNPEGLVSARTAPVVGAVPVVVISAPTAGAIFTTTNTITFTATATDAEDGNIAANLVWNSSLLGQIGTGATFSRTLTMGQHIITARVTDSAGNLGYASVAITVNLAGNTAPTVTISSPTNGAAFLTGATVTFIGTAMDAEDGTLTSLIHWYYGSALLGIGGTNSVALGDGTFLIKAVVTDGGLLSATNSVIIVVGGSIVVPTPPVITLLSPTNGVTLPATNFPAFSCTVIDAVDGDISNSAYWWISPADCPTGWCEVRFATNTIQWYGVSQGWWTWRITATNSALLAATNTFSYFIDRGLSNEPPVITITAPPSGSVFTNGTPIAFAQTCYDAIDGNWADEVTWTSSIDGLFINTNSVNTGAWERVVTNSSLSLGQHTIMVSAIDKGINGAPPFATNTVMTSLTIVTYNPALTALSVTATPNKTSYRHKEKVTVTAHVTSSGTNVPNAALTFSFAYRDTRRAPHTLYATAMTDSSGNGSAIFPIPASSVAGTATIPVTATKIGYQSDNATATFTILTR